MHDLSPSDGEELEAALGSDKLYSSLFTTAVSALESSGTHLHMSRFRYIEGDQKSNPSIEVVDKKWQYDPPRYIAYVASKLTSDGQSELPPEKQELINSKYYTDSERFNLEAVLNAMLSDESAHELAHAAMTLNLDDIEYNAARGKRRHIFKTFFEHGENIFDTFLQAVHEFHGSENEMEVMTAEKFIGTMNVEVRGWIAKDKHDAAHSLLHALHSHGFVRVDELNNVNSMTDPVTAGVLAQKAESEDVFSSIKPTARRNMANLLLQSVLERFAASPDRQQRNAGLIKELLFSSKSYDRTLPMLDLLHLANSFTERLNQSLSDDKKRALLPVNGEGSSMLTNCGEAIFRILSMTATTTEHASENRNYAELFDALMKPYYQEFEKSRSVTLADVCARYPDAKKDVVLELQTIATEKGYSAASNYYKTVSREYGSHSRRRKHMPGYGVIS